MKLVIPKIKHRPAGHRALFSDDMPFKPKSERRRDGYQRRDKHNKRLFKDWGYEYQ